MYVVLGEYHFEYVLSPLILTLFMIPFWLSRFIFLSNPIDSLLLIKISIFQSAFLPVRFLFMFLFHHRLASPAL